ncbi:MAG: hypothetical protein ACYCPQ_00775 [Elusimicrobiota bacterium]
MNTNLQDVLETEEKIFEDAPLKDVEDEKDPAKIKQKKPPKDGLCRRCGENKPINRLMLCYPCWVKSNLEKSGWREGMSHPDWCACEGVSGHERLSNGN